MNTTRNTTSISKLHGIDVLTMMSHNVKICHVRTKCNNFSPLICKLMAAILDFKLIGVLKKLSEMKFSFKIERETFFVTKTAMHDKNLSKYHN